MFPVPLEILTTYQFQTACNLSITDGPKLEQFPLLATFPVNGHVSVHLPTPHADLVKSKVQKTKMPTLMPTLIRPFRGVQNNLEDPEEYIEGLEWAYAQDFQLAETSDNLEARQVYINKTYRILFRNNLEGTAVE